MWGRLGNVFEDLRLRFPFTSELQCPLADLVVLEESPIDSQVLAAMRIPVPADVVGAVRSVLAARVHELDEAEPLSEHHGSIP